jgi:arginyl-tRNA synthetase
VLEINVSAPGFLNFTLPDDYYENYIESINADFGASIASNTFAGKTVICEFSDPNPFKVLHVGHLYTSIVGDSISRLFEYAGANVIRANFGGDVGLHVAKTMYYLLRKTPAELTIEDIADCYVKGTAAYEDNEEARQEITKLNKEIYQINAAGIARTGDANRGTPKMFAEGKILGDNSRQDPSGDRLADYYWRGRELSYEYFKDFYAKIGVHFDKFYPESTVAALGLKTVKEQLEKGVYELSDGAVIFNGEKYGLHTRVFINKEGVPTYEAKDVGLILTKNNDYHFDKSVVITGSEQLEYMKVVLKSVEQFAPDLVAKTSHLTHGLVKLPGNVKMSSRKGNFLKAVDVLDMIDDALAEEYNSHDAKVSLAATKYAFLKYKMGGNIIFDPHESVKMTGNSGPYLLYSAVRAKKILNNSRLLSANKPSELGVFRSAAARELAREPRGDGSERRDPKLDVCSLHTSERGLAKKLLEYKTILDGAVTEMAPHKVANYLYELAQDFSRFYENCPVAGSDREEQRVKLVQVFLATMTHGLNILGIEIPEEM